MWVHCGFKCFNFGSKFILHFNISKKYSRGKIETRIIYEAVQVYFQEGPVMIFYFRKQMKQTVGIVCYTSFSLLLFKAQIFV